MNRELQEKQQPKTHHAGGGRRLAGRRAGGRREWLAEEGRCTRRPAAGAMGGEALVRGSTKKGTSVPPSGDSGGGSTGSNRARRSREVGTRAGRRRGAAPAAGGRALDLHEPREARVFFFGDGGHAAGSDDDDDLGDDTGEAREAGPNVDSGRRGNLDPHGTQQISAAAAAPGMSGGDGDHRGWVRRPREAEGNRRKASRGGGGDFLSPRARIDLQFQSGAEPQWRRAGMAGHGG